MSEAAQQWIPTRVTNFTGGRFRGPIRRVVDRMPPFPTGEVDGVRYVLGRKLGECGWLVDLFVDLAPGQSIEVDLEHAEPATRDEWVPEPRKGLVKIGGVPMRGTFGPDGGMWLVRASARVTPMLHVDLWVPVRGDVPWCIGELVVCASNPTVPDLTVTIPPNFRLEVEGAQVLVPGLGLGAPLLPAGEILGDGQAKSFPVLIAWTEEFLADDWSSAYAALSQAIGCVARTTIGPLGVPAVAPPRFNVLEWMRRHYGNAIRELHTWDAGMLGVVANSTVSGDQEDQGVAPPAEALLPGGCGAEIIRYLDALGQSRRPCHHLNADGSQFEPDDHPNALVWDGRFDLRGRDWRGKTRALVGSLDAHGWWGPDRQHWWLVTLCSAYELTGSPALQWQIQAQARLYLAQWTVDPRKTTSSPDAPRATCMEGIFAAWLHRTLEDRALAERVATRYRERIERIILPAFTRATVVKAWQVWGASVTTDEVGGGFTQAWQAYHQAIAAFGLDVGCAYFNIPAGRALALDGALAVIDHAYTFNAATGRWIEWDAVGYNADGSALRPEQYSEKQGAHRTGWFRHSWFPCAAATVLRHDPAHARARAIYEQIRAEAMLGTVPLDWFPDVPAVPVAEAAK